MHTRRPRPHQASSHEFQLFKSTQSQPNVQDHQRACFVCDYDMFMFNFPGFRTLITHICRKFGPVSPHLFLDVPMKSIVNHVDLISLSILILRGAFSLHSAIVSSIVVVSKQMKKWPLFNHTREALSVSTIARTHIETSGRSSCVTVVVLTVLTLDEAGRKVPPSLTKPCLKSRIFCL